jgi:hypothetical protein
VVIGVDSLGKEELLVDVAVSLEVLIKVTPEKYRLIEVVGGLPSVFTMNADATFVSAVPKQSLTSSL